MTHYWRGIKFTQTYGKHSADPAGWEATCACKAHRATKTICKRTYLFAAHGGRLLVEKKLKYWALSAGKHPDRLAHKAARDPDDLPSLALLERMEPSAPPDSS